MCGAIRTVSSVQGRQRHPAGLTTQFLHRVNSLPDRHLCRARPLVLAMTAHAAYSYTVWTAVTSPRGSSYVPDPLSVSPDGLNSASAALSENAGQLGAVTISSPTGNKASSAGAAAVAVAITTFSRAYADHLTDRARSAGAAAGSYATIDGHEAANIGSVSV